MSLRLTQNYDRFLIGPVLTDARIEAYERLGRYGEQRRVKAEARLGLQQLRKQVKPTTKQLLKKYDL